MNPMISVPNVEGHILFSKIWGSHSHNTAIPDSDIDYLGVYVASNESLLGMRQPPETVVGEKPDYQFHEVGKFCNLLLKGNPGILEMLYTERMFYCVEPWDTLVFAREAFLSKKAVEAYLGYCQGQLAKLTRGASLHTTGGKYNTKWAYHLARAVEDAERIACGFGPIVWKEGHELEWLMSIRRGEIDKDRLVQNIGDRIVQIKSREWKVPECGDATLLNEWLLGVRGL